MAVAKGFDIELDAGAAIRFPAAYNDADEIPESNAGKNKNKKARKANNIAMAYFHMAVDLGKYTGCLAKACDDDYPNLQAYLAWDLLQRKYAKTDMLSTSKLRQDLKRLRLK